MMVAFPVYHPGCTLTFSNPKTKEPISEPQGRLSKFSYRVTRYVFDSESTQTFQRFLSIGLLINGTKFYIDFKLLAIYTFNKSLLITDESRCQEANIFSWTNR